MYRNSKPEVIEDPVKVQTQNDHIIDVVKLNNLEVEGVEANKQKNMGSCEKVCNQMGVQEINLT